MIQALANLSPFASQMALIALGLAFFVSIGIVILANFAVRRAARRRALAPKTPIKVDGVTYPQTITEKAGNFLNEVKELRKKFYHAWTGTAEDEISKSFQQTLQLLKTYLGDRNFKYRIPWYVMMGPEGAGKSTLLNATRLDLPIGRPSYEFQGDRPKVDWWFFDQGIVMDLQGSLALGRRNVKFHQAQWTHFLNLLNRFRPQRPLDGVILTIPADELIGPQALPKERWVERSQALYARLRSLQTTLAMRVPVYVVITKTDIVPGFKSFTQELPDDSLTQIFGWSSPHGVDSYYAANWVEDLFGMLTQNIRRTRGMIYAETVGRDQSYRDRSITFARHLSTLKPGVQTFLDQIFKETALHDGFFLRGVYFTGDNGVPDAVQATAEGAAEAQKAPEEKGAADKEGKKGKNEIEEPFDPLADKTGALPAFFHDLLQEKIFPEGGIAQPIRRIIISTSRSLNFAKTAVATVALGWSYQLMYARTHLGQVNTQVHPVLEKIERTLDGISRLSSYAQRPQLEMFLNEQSEDLIRMMSDVERLNTTLVGVPASWGGKFDDRLRQGITIAYDQVILRAMHLELMKKAKSTVTEGVVVFDEEAIQSDANPLNLYTFKQFNRYVKDVEELEANVRLYNNLEHSQSVRDLAHIIKFLYNRTPPAQFFEKQRYYAQVLSQTKDNVVSLRPYREHAQKKLRQLTTNFASEAFNVRHTLPQLIKVTDLVESFARPTTLMNGDRLRDILKELSTLNTIFSSSKIRWVEGARFDPGEAYSKTMTGVARADLFGMTLAEDLTQQMDEGFKKYKKSLGEIKTSLTGPVIMKNKGVLSVEASENLAKLSEVLQTFLDTTFMAQEPNQRSTIAVPPGKLLLWDEITLQSAVNLVEEYNAFVTGELNQINPELRAIFKVVARNTIRSKVINLIARSQTYVDDQADTLSIGRRELLANQVQNFKAVAPLFGKLLGSFEGGGFVLTSTGIREVLLSQSYLILRKADSILQADGLYNIRGSNFAWWRGESGLGFKAFGVHDNDGMSAYLAASVSPC
ncbi:hypothetical protein OAN22_01395 [Alphaproteobacteria bacterium]|nr:hypothetical protein [Alphaproteobacteria bacterium]